MNEFDNKIADIGQVYAEEANQSNPEKDFIPY